MAQQKINYSQPNDNLGNTLRSMAKKLDDNFDELYANKVDKIVGKGLSDTNFSAVDKAKLDSLNTNQNPQSNFTQGDALQPDFIKNKPTKLSQFDNDPDFVQDVTQAGIYGRQADNWVLLSNGSPSNIFKFVQKGFGNVDQNNYQAGDIFCGWSNDGSIRHTESIYNGGVLTDSNNFTHLVQTQLT